MPGAYPDFGWLDRAVRLLPVVAVALGIGGAIGGFSMFAVDSALTPPPPQAGSASHQASATPSFTSPVPLTNAAPLSKSVRTIDVPGDGPDAAPTEPGSTNVWPDPLFRAQDQKPAAPGATPQPPAQQP